jgi:hypothetical protein
MTLTFAGLFSIVIEEGRDVSAPMEIVTERTEITEI